MAPQCAGEWGSGVAFSVATVGARPTPPRYGCACRRHIRISRWPEPERQRPRTRRALPDPASSGQTVTCSGNTPAGFQAGGGVDSLTLNVLPGATVSDGGGGVIIGVNDFNTVTNSGTLSAGPNSTGIFAGVNNTIVNDASGVISLGDHGLAIFVAGDSPVTNAGQITVTTGPCRGAGIVAINDDNTVSNLAGATITVSDQLPSAS